MNVLSLFDGMSCGQIALRQLGIPINKYYAAEIDPYAMRVTQNNFPETIHLGDVTKVKGADLEKIDLLLGGSPCQGFSFAGKQLNFDDPRSALFFEFVRLLKECNPKYFLLENVRMKKEYQDVITEHLGVEPIMINSALVSAQNRVRLYWTNIPNITQPEDRDIVLKDILENEFESDRDKSYCIDANYYKGANWEQYKNKARRQLVFNYSSSGRGNKKVEDRFYESLNKKAHALTATGYTKRSLTGVAILQKPRGNNKGGYRAINGKTPTLTSNSWEQNNFVTDKMYYRKLTPLECERLQTVPDGYTEGVSNTQRYKMLGNGWTVEVIKHVLQNIT